MSIIVNIIVFILKYKKYILSGIAALLLSLYIYNNAKRVERIKNLEENLNILKNTLEESNNQIIKLIDLRKEDQVKVDLLNNKLTVIDISNSEKISDITKFRSKLNLVSQGKPELIGRFATKATKQLMNDFYNITGGVNEN